MRFTLFSALALIGSKVSASGLVERATSSNCAQAVAGTSRGIIFQATAKKDCTSNLIVHTSTIVTPPASTFVSTVTAQDVSYITKTIISTGSTTLSPTVKSTQTLSYTLTEYSTSTDVSVSTQSFVTVPTVTLTSVVTLTSASTFTSYTPTASAIRIIGPVKRDVVERDTLSASPTIPAYASACTNFAQYQSACSAVGVTASTIVLTTMLPVPTVTAFSTVTATSIVELSITTQSDLIFTQTQTLQTSTSVTTDITLPATTTAYQTVLETITASTSTAYVYQTLTVPGDALSTTVPIRPFKLLMVPVAGGPNLYMMSLIGDGVVSKSVTDASLASTYTIDTLNRLITTDADPEIACESNSIANYYINNVRPSFLNSHPSYQSMFKPLTCQMNGDVTVTCTYKTATAFTLYNSQWFYSVPNFNNYPTYVAHAVFV